MPAFTVVVHFTGKEARQKALHTHVSEFLEEHSDSELHVTVTPLGATSYPMLHLKAELWWPQQSFNDDAEKIERLTPQITDLCREILHIPQVKMVHCTIPSATMVIKKYRRSYPKKQ